MKSPPGLYHILLCHSGKTLLLGAICLSGSLTARATPPVVTNVIAGQRPGTKLVDIHYDLTHSGPKPVEIRIRASSDGGGTWSADGITWSVPAYTFTGDYGTNIASSAGKWAVWDAGTDWNGQYTTNCRVRVVATEAESFVLIPAGTFVMGDSSGDSIANAPAHSVSNSAFYISDLKVTANLWNQVCQRGGPLGYDFGSGSDGGLMPEASSAPVFVNWYGAVKWCNLRSELEGRRPCYYLDSSHLNPYRVGHSNLDSSMVDWAANGYRLPTEAEWEKAARGGLVGKRFPWGDTISQTNASYLSDPASYAYDLGPAGYSTNQFAASVAAFEANGYGLFDMAGNSWEWCWDFYDPAYYSQSPTVDPRGPFVGTFMLPPICPDLYARVARGGSSQSPAPLARCANRSYGSPDCGNASFRCVRGF